MEVTIKSSTVNDHHHHHLLPNYNQHLFLDSLKDLRNVRQQLYSAADHFEDSYHKNDQKQMLLESLKDYISKSLIKTIDHLGSLTYKLNKFLDHNLKEVSRTNFRVLYIDQRLGTCEAYANNVGLLQQSLMTQTPKYPKHYIVPEGCISEASKAEKEKVESSGLRKGYSGHFPPDLVDFSFTKAARNKRLEKSSRSISPHGFPVKRLSSASCVHRSISPNRSRKQQPVETWRSYSLYTQRQGVKNTRKTKNLFKVLLSMYKSRNKA